MPDGPRYDDDFYAWTQYQARVLREMPAPDDRFARENVAEEIESVGRNERDAVRSQARRVIEHLLKLEYSPAGEPHRGWRGSVIDARAELGDRLSTTLRHDLSSALGRLHATARKRVTADLEDHDEQDAAASLPLECPYTLDQILAEDWCPEPAGDKK